MTSAFERIQEAGPLHNALTQSINSLGADLFAVSRQSDRVLDLRQRVKAANEAFDKLRRTTEKERAQFTKQRDSNIKKLSSKLLGKSVRFQEKVGAKERNYSDALAEEVKARTEKDELSNQLLSEETIHKELLATSSHREQLYTDLDDMYDAIFRGHTPEFPEEDRVEALVELSEAEVVAAQSLVDVVDLAHELLTQALSKIQLCIAQLKAVPSTALTKGHGMTAFNDDLLHTVTGNKAIHAARALATQSDTLLQRTKELLPSVNIPQPMLISGARTNEEQFRFLLTNNPTRDVAEDSIQHGQDMIQLLQSNIEEVNTILNTAREDVTKKVEHRNQQRAELRLIRHSIFQSVLEGKTTPRTMSPAPSVTSTLPPPLFTRTPSPSSKPHRASYHSSIAPKKLPIPPSYSPPPAVTMILEPLRRQSPSIAGSYLS